jgi:hypothetical protein
VSQARIAAATVTHHAGVSSAFDVLVSSEALARGEPVSDLQR